MRCSIINAYGGCINCIIVNDSPVRHFSIKWASCFKISFGWETIRESALSRPCVKLYSLNWLAQERKIVYLTALRPTKDHMFLKKKDARSINKCKITHYSIFSTFLHLISLDPSSFNFSLHWAKRIWISKLDLTFRASIWKITAHWLTSLL